MDGSDTAILELEELEIECPEIMEVARLSTDGGISFFKLMAKKLKGASAVFASRLLCAANLYCHGAEMEGSNVTSRSLGVALSLHFAEVVCMLSKVGISSLGDTTDASELSAWNVNLADNFLIFLSKALLHMHTMERSATVFTIRCLGAAALAGAITNVISPGCENGKCGTRCVHSILCSEAAMFALCILSNQSSDVPKLPERVLRQAVGKGGSCNDIQWGGFLLGLLNQRTTAALEGTITSPISRHVRVLASDIRKQAIVVLRALLPVLEGFRGEAYRAHPVAETLRLRTMVAASRTAITIPSPTPTPTAEGTPSCGAAGIALSTKTCVSCGKPASFLCSGCESEPYCGRSCQRVAWKAGHKHTCGRS
jgi:hypothetical protein